MLRCLLVSALVAGSAIVLSAPNVNAQSVNMPFTGTIATGCTFGPPTTGTLVPTPDVNPTSLSSSISLGGTQSTVSINCATPANITISAPIQTSGPTFTPTSCTARVRLPGGGSGLDIGLGSCVGTGAPQRIGGSLAVIVDMSVSNPAGIPSGTYGYNVTLSIVP